LGTFQTDQAKVRSHSKNTVARQKRLVLCLTGMPGAGKSTAADVSLELGFEVFRMGDDVRLEVERRKLPPTGENLGAVMLQLRQAGGPAAIAHLCKQRIERDSKSAFVLIDGIRNWSEFLEFRKLDKAVLISIHASPEKRFNFLQSRARSDSPASLESFEVRDKRELSVGIGEAIALADEVITNSGSVAELEGQVRKLFKNLKSEFESGSMPN
jgi:dephospho-CoA kinase